MRSVSFVDHLEFEFSGNVLDGGLTLGDVDNDGNSEFVVANTAGDLAIFKGMASTPWRQFHGLGMVACIVLGDICNVYQNVLFCITSEGWCHLLWFGCGIDHQECKEWTVVDGGFDVATYHQSLPTNSKTALVADVDGDGEMELVIGSTDRVVRVFKWTKEERKEAQDVKPSEKTLVKQNSKEGKIQKQNSKEGKGLFKQTQSKADPTIAGNVSGSGSTSGKGTSENRTLFEGKFVCVKKWKLSGQVESLSVVDGRSGTSPAILVSQPGGAYIYLVCAEESLKENLQKQTGQLMPQDSIISFADCHSTTESSSKSHHPLTPKSDMSSIPAHMVSWVCKPARSCSTPSNFIAMCTLNGTLAVIKDDKLNWSVDLNHNFFAVQKVDITGNGTDEVVFCAWDGETYIMDQYENMVNFKFGEAVSAFSSGLYAVNEEGSLPCLVYVTFHNRIRLYWNVKMRGLESRNFSDAVVAKLNDFNLDPKYSEFMVLEDGSIDNERIKQLTSWCLYGGRQVKHDG